MASAKLKRLPYAVFLGRNRCLGPCHKMARFEYVSYNNDHLPSSKTALKLVQLRRSKMLLIKKLSLHTIGVLFHAASFTLQLQLPLNGKSSNSRKLSFLKCRP